jgi:hypothetical protein
MKNILFDQKKIKLLSKWYFVENKTSNATKTAVSLLVAVIYKMNSRGCFSAHLCM